MGDTAAGSYRSTSPWRSHGVSNPLNSNVVVLEPCLDLGLFNILIILWQINDDDVMMLT